jgi:hypothetical protein
MTNYRCILNVLWGILVITGGHVLNGHIYDMPDINLLTGYIQQAQATYDCYPTDMLIVCDIDNTLLTIDHPHDLGTDQWFEQYFQHLIQHAQLSNIDALQQAIREYVHLQFQLTTRLVQDNYTVNAIQYSYIHHIPLIFLTVRSYELASLTHYELSRHNLLWPHTTHVHDFNEHFLRVDNVLLTQGGSKGCALQYYLQKSCQRLPRVIIMIDDKLKHLQIVEQVCIHLAIPFIGLRYSYQDAAVQTFRFDPQIHSSKLWTRSQSPC